MCTFLHRSTIHCFPARARGRGVFACDACRPENNAHVCGPPCPQHVLRRALGGVRGDGKPPKAVYRPPLHCWAGAHKLCLVRVLMRSRPPRIEVSTVCGHETGGGRKERNTHPSSFDRGRRLRGNYRHIGQNGATVRMHGTDMVRGRLLTFTHLHVPHCFADTTNARCWVNGEWKWLTLTTVTWPPRTTRAG